jgi:hypothetical protein
MPGLANSAAIKPFRHDPSVMDAITELWRNATSWWEQFASDYGILVTGISALACVAGLFAMRYLVIHLPADFFTREEPRPDKWINSHPATRWTLWIAKNIAGALLLVMGVAMLVLPGPGVLSLLLGLTLMDVPGKRRAERWLIGIPAVNKKINKVRAKYQQRPIEMPKSK